MLDTLLTILNAFLCITRCDHIIIAIPILWRRKRKHQEAEEFAQATWAVWDGARTHTGTVWFPPHFCSRCALFLSTKRKQVQKLYCNLSTAPTLEVVRMSSSQD